MATSAFATLILPICWATMGGLALGPMILAAMDAIDSPIGHVGRPAPRRA